MFEHRTALILAKTCCQAVLSKFGVVVLNKDVNNETLRPPEKLTENPNHGGAFLC